MAEQTLTPPAEAPKLVEERDSVREGLETVAFVVFLVLLLKAFVAEAFVIPTGSMAITLFGDHTTLNCARCKYEFTSNNQLNTQARAIGDVECPNCRYRMSLGGGAARPPEGGDKVLVLKPQYDLHPPARHDVIVFKFPGEPNYLPRPDGGPFAAEDGLKRKGGPQEDFGPRNFIKRLWGLPGEKLAIWQGDVYLAVKGPDGQEKLEIIRRDPKFLLSMRRLVNDNEYLSLSDAQGAPVRTRWKSGQDWLTDPAAPAWRGADGERTDRTFVSAANPKTQWLRYRNVHVPGSLPRPDEPANRQMARPAPPAGAPAGPSRPQLITDFLEYNEDHDQHHHWVGDLMVECAVDVQEPKGELILELRRGVDRFQAIFDLATGDCRLEGLREGTPLKLENAVARGVLKPGTHRLRFADFDERLTLWVDERLPFGAGVTFPAVPQAARGPRLADLFPASIGARDAKVSVSQLSLWRDIYYTQAGGHDVDANKDAIAMAEEQIRKLAEGERLAPQGALSGAERALHLLRPREWDVYVNGASHTREGVPTSMAEPKFYPTQHPKWHPSDRFDADEHFALGDNAVQSKDSRYWGQVPKRLLMGKAVWVYWPYSRWFLIR